MQRKNSLAVSDAKKELMAEALAAEANEVALQISSSVFAFQNLLDYANCASTCNNFMKVDLEEEEVIASES